MFILLYDVTTDYRLLFDLIYLNIFIPTLYTIFPYTTLFRSYQHDGAGNNDSTTQRTIVGFGQRSRLLYRIIKTRGHVHAVFIKNVARYLGELIEGQGAR